MVTPAPATVATATIVAAPGEAFSLAHLLPPDATNNFGEGGISSESAVQHLGRLRFIAGKQGLANLTIPTSTGRIACRILVTKLAPVLRRCSPPAALKEAIAQVVQTPDEPAPWSRLGNVLLLELGEQSRALQAYLEAITRGGAGAVLFNNLGSCLYRMGRLGPAKTSLLRAIEDKPDFPHPHYWLAKICRDEARPEAEEEQWHAYIRLGPSEEGRWREAASRLATLMPGVPACKACGIPGVELHRRVAVCEVCIEALVRMVDDACPKGPDGHRRGRAPTEGEPCPACGADAHRVILQRLDLRLCDACVDALAGSSGDPRLSGDTEQPWSVGDVIDETYEVTHVHESGGMAHVVRVRHKEWGVDLAVKRPRRELFVSEADLTSFEREAEIGIGLGVHPHVVGCHYVRRLGGVPCIVSDYVDGGTLDDWIQDGRLYRQDDVDPGARILDVAIQIAWGLHYAHKRGLVHQDVKPGNVLMTPAGTARLSDFGLARARAKLRPTSGPVRPGATTVARARAMTREYASPEQAAGATRLSRKTDIWSWALTVLSMYAGGLCWRWGPLAETTLQSVLEDRDGTLPPIPAGVSDLLRRCFCNEPDDRPRDMEAITRVLSDIYAQVAGAPYPRSIPDAARLHADALNNRALSLLDLGKDADAEATWREALQVDPCHPESVYNLGLRQWRSGEIRDDDLVRRLNETVASNAAPEHATLLLARVNLERNEAIAALESIERAVSADAKEIAALSYEALLRASRSRRVLRSIEKHTGGHLPLALSRCGTFAAAMFNDNVLELWDLAAGRCVRRFADEDTTGSFTYTDMYAIHIDAELRTILSLAKRNDDHVTIWDVAAGRRLRRFSAHRPVRSAWSSGDGRLIALGHADGSVSIFSGAADAPALRIEGVGTNPANPDHTRSVDEVYLTRDGSTLLTGTYGGIALWSAQTGERIAAFAVKTDSVSVSHDERLVAVGSSDTIEIWDLASRKHLRTLRASERPQSYRPSSISSVSLSEDGMRLLSVQTDWETPNVLRLWDTTTGRCLWSLQDDGSRLGKIMTARLTPDSSHAAVLGYDGLRLWAMHAPQPAYQAPPLLARPSRTDVTVADAAACAELLREASAALDAGDAADAARRIEQARSLPGYEHALEASRDWTRLYRRLSRRRLRAAWQVASFQGERGSIASIATTPDSKHVLAVHSSGALSMWDLTSHEHAIVESSASVEKACLSGDGRRLACLLAHVSSDEPLHVRIAGAELRGTTAILGEALPDPAPRSWMRSVSTTFDGRLILAGGHHVEAQPGGRNLLDLWDAVTGVLLRRFAIPASPGDEFDDAGGIEAVWMSPDGAWALSGHGWSNCKIHIWDVASGKCVKKLIDPHSGRSARRGESHACVRSPDRLIVPALAGSFDGRLVVSGGHQDHLVKIWEAETGDCRHVLRGHTGPITSVCFSFDGRLALSASADKTVRVWDVQTGDCLRVLVGHEHAVSVVGITPDAGHVVSGDHGGVVKVWLLDWELEGRSDTEWDGAATSILDAFLRRQTPYLARWAADLPEGALARALTRGGSPAWTEAEFATLLDELACAGFGQLRPEIVRSVLEQRTPSVPWRRACSFCGTTYALAKHLVAGAEHSICDACIMRFSLAPSSAPPAGSCSFCGGAAPDVVLAGFENGATICAECVDSCFWELGEER